MHIHDFRIEEAPEEHFPDKDQNADADQCDNHFGYVIFLFVEAEVKEIARPP